MLTAAIVLGSAFLLRLRTRALHRTRCRLRIEQSASGETRHWADVWRVRLRRREEAAAAMIQLPEVIEAMARSLRAGASLRGALIEGSSGATGQLGDDLRRVGADVSAGVALPDALDGWGSRYRSPIDAPRPDRRRRSCWPRRHSDGPLQPGNGEALVSRRATTGRSEPLLVMTATVLAIAAELGGAQAKTLDGLVVTLRDQRTMAGEVRAASAQARLSAWVMVGLPIGFALVQALTNRESAHFLLATPAGGACVVIGLTLDGIGALWMHRMVRPP